jgi:FkbM family methyltransferase
MPTTAAVRKLASSVHAFQEGGTREVLGRLQMNARELRARLLGVDIDGCNFSIRGVPVLLRRELISKPYEYPERISIRQFIDCRLPIIELGGCIGVVSCLANRLIGPSLKQVVVEANPKLVPIIQANARRNGCDLEVVNAAICDKKGFVSFHVGDGEFSQLASSLLDDGSMRSSVEVPACSLAELLERFAIQDCNLICDIEGSEYDLVQHELDVITLRVSRIIMEVHPHLLGLTKIDSLIFKLKTAGFVLASRVDNVIAFMKDSGQRACNVPA